MEFFLNYFIDRFQHLTHTPFKYNIQINNASNQNKIGLCRIFMAPRYDEVGQELYLMDQRFLMIEMDKFTVQCMNFFRSIYKILNDIICFQFSKSWF